MSLPAFVAAGEALTDLIRTGDGAWASAPGGATWNVARAVATLGMPSAFAGAISRDCFGDEIAAASRDAGLDMRFLQRHDKAPLIAVVHRTHPPEYFFLGNDTADLAFEPQRLPAGWEQAVAWAHFGGISLARPPLSTALAALADRLKRHGARISYDPNMRAIMGPRYRAMFETFCHLADLIKVSDHDLHELFGGDPRAAIEQVRALNPRATLLYTEGEKGATLYIGEERWRALPPRIEVVDTVGAGDTAIGAMLYSLMRHPERGPGEHLRFSIAAGAAACRRRGAGWVTLGDVLVLFEETRIS